MLECTQVCNVNQCTNAQMKVFGICATCTSHPTLSLPELNHKLLKLYLQGTAC